VESEDVNYLKLFFIMVIYSKYEKYSMPSVNMPAIHGRGNGSTAKGSAQIKTQVKKVAIYSLF